MAGVSGEESGPHLRGEMWAPDSPGVGLVEGGELVRLYLGWGLPVGGLPICREGLKSLAEGFDRGFEFALEGFGLLAVGFELVFGAVEFVDEALGAFGAFEGG